MLKVNSKIKNIIFDFGGVILNIDFQRCNQAFSNLGLNNFDEIYSQISQTSLFDELETGILTPEEFYKKMRKFSQMPWLDIEIEAAWNAMLLDIPFERIILLRELSKRYRIFLLSNTNVIHYSYYLSDLQNVYNIMDFNSLFEKCFFSFQCGMRKPDPIWYKKILSDNKLSPAESLFIDDSAQNLVPALNLGLQVFHLKKGLNIVDELKDW